MALRLHLVFVFARRQRLARVVVGVEEALVVVHLPLLLIGRHETPAGVDRNGLTSRQDARLAVLRRVG